MGDWWNSFQSSESDAGTAPCLQMDSSKRGWGSIYFPFSSLRNEFSPLQPKIFTNREVCPLNQKTLGIKYHIYYWWQQGKIIIFIHYLSTRLNAKINRFFLQTSTNEASSNSLQIFTSSPSFLAWLPHRKKETNPSWRNDEAYKDQQWHQGQMFWRRLVMTDCSHVLLLLFGYLSCLSCWPSLSTRSV